MSKPDVDYKEFFENEAQLGAIYWIHLIVGAALFLIIFLVGWLAFDYFWTALIIGIIAFLYVFKRALNISMAKNAYDAFVREAKEEAEELGMDGAKAEMMAKNALSVLVNAAMDNKSK